MYPEEREAEKLTQQFLQKRHAEGRISSKELSEISLGRGGFGCVKPDTLTRIDDFVARIHVETGLPIEDVQRILMLHLKSVQLTVRHLEIYLNYPAWSECGLAAAFGISRKNVVTHIAAVRRTWSGLRFDALYEGNYGVTSMTHMLRIETSANSDDRLNGDEVIKF